MEATEFWQNTLKWSEQEQAHAAELGRGGILEGIGALPAVVLDGDFMVNARMVVQFSLGWFASDKEIEQLRHDAHYSNAYEMITYCDKALAGDQDALVKVTAVIEGGTFDRPWE